MLKKILLFIYLIVNQPLIAQDNQRYLALVLVNIDEKDDNLGVKEIEKAHQLGFNAVNIAVLWDYVKVYRANTPNPWIQVDNQMKKASELGMKIGLRIWIDGWCGDDRKNQWCSNFSPDEIMVNGEGRYDFAQSGPGKRSMTSFAANSSLLRLKTFTTEVIERYKKYQDNGDILYVSLATTGEQELGYPYGSTSSGDGLFDYSAPMKEAYRVWLRKKYCNDLTLLKKAWGEAYTNLKTFNEVEPKYSIYHQYSFEGQDGQDWYKFRHFMLKRFNTEFMQTVKAAKTTRPFKIVNDYGSVFDHLSVRRGTLGFQDLGEGTDGIKINDALGYNHRFGMDLMRSNMPNKWIMNEAIIDKIAYSQTEAEVYSQESFQQIDQSFAHGANLVAYFPGVAGKTSLELLENSTKYVALIKNKWLNNKAPIQVQTKGKMTMKLSEFIFDGCLFGAGRCKAITQWQQIFNTNGGLPVEIAMEEDFIKENPSVCSNSGINAEYEGILEKADCQGGYGWIINKSNINASVKYEIYLDGKLIKSSVADSLNPNSQKYTASARHGFSFKIPTISDGEHALKIKIPESSYLIANAKVNLTCKNAGKQTQITPIVYCAECTELNVYPNPAQDRIALGFNLQGFKPVLIEIIDLQGRRVYYSDTYGVEGNNDLEINTQNFTPATYLINVKIDQKYYQRKFVKK